MPTKSDSEEKNPLAGLDQDQRQALREQAEERRGRSEASDRDDVLTAWTAQHGAAGVSRVNPVYAEDPVRFSAEELPPPEAARRANIAPQRIPEEQIADEEYAERYEASRPALQGSAIRRREAEHAVAAAKERGHTLEDREVIGADTDKDTTVSDVDGGGDVTADDDGGSSDSQGDGPTQGGPGDGERRETDDDGGDTSSTEGDGGDTSSTEKPNKSDNKDAWVDYAEYRGMDRSEAEKATKEDLINQYG